MTPSNVGPLDDYEELIAILNSHRVEYIIIGAYAVGQHGYVRGTDDMDIAVDPSPENAAKLAAALKAFAAVEVDPAEITKNTIIELGRDPNSVDILTTIKGVAWQKAWSTRIISKVGEQPAPFLSRECLIESKLAAGRPKDHLDLQGLGAEPLPEPKPGSQEPPQ